MKWVVLSVLFLHGCVTPRGFVKDPSMPAKEANYPTAEFRLRGQIYHGSGETSLPVGTPYKRAKLQVQGYLDGVIKVDSERCRFSQSYEYTDSALVDIPIPGKASSSCLIDIMVIPSIPEEAADPAPIYPLKGQALIKTLAPEHRWYGTSDKVRKGKNADILIPASQPASSRVVFRGCGADFSRRVNPRSGGSFEVSLDEIIRREMEVETCSFEGAVINYPRTTYVSWRVWSYHPKFSPLSKPELSFNGDGELRVRANKAVSVIFSGRKYMIDNEAVIPFNKKKKQVLRFLTAKGRSAICKWMPDTESWLCLT